MRALLIAAAAAAASALVSLTTDLPVLAVALCLAVVLWPSTDPVRTVVHAGGILLALGPPLAWLSVLTHLPLVRLAACVGIGWCAGRLASRGRGARVGTFDGIALVAIIVGAAMVAWPLLHPGSAEAALGRLMVGWDHSSHFSMYLDVRTGTGVAPLTNQPTPDGSGWYFAHYPLWWHGVLAALAQLSWGATGTTAQELVRYGQLQAGVNVLFSAVALALVLVSTRQRSRAVRFAGTVCAFSALLGVPGTTNLIGAHAAFTVAIVATAGVVLLLQYPWCRTPLGVVTLVGFAAGCASWPLLIPVAAAGAVVPLARALRESGGRERAWLVGGLVASAALASLSVATVAGAPVGETLNGSGGVLRIGLVVALGVPLLLAGLSARGRGSRDLLRVSVMALVLMVGIGAWQLATTGGLQYYFWKVALATTTILVLLAAPLLTSDDHGAPVAPRPLWRAAVVVAGLAGIGVLAGAPAALVFVTANPALAQGVGSRREAACLLTVSAHLEPRSAAASTLVWSTGGSVDPALTNQWFHTLARARTYGAEDATGILTAAPTPLAAAAAVRATGGDVLLIDPAGCTSVPSTR